LKNLAELADQDRNMRGGEFACMLRHLGRAKGNISNAAGLAAGGGAPPRVVECLKAAVTSGGLTAWGDQLVEFRQMGGAFLDTLRWSSIFFRMLSDNGIIRLPFEVRVGSIFAASGAAVITKGQAIPVSRMDIGAAELARQRPAPWWSLRKNCSTAAPQLRA
jgi:hypothetical protein